MKNGRLYFSGGWYRDSESNVEDSTEGQRILHPNHLRYLCVEDKIWLIFVIVRLYWHIADFKLVYFTTFTINQSMLNTDSSLKLHKVHAYSACILQE